MPMHRKNSDINGKRQPTAKYDPDRFMFETRAFANLRKRTRRRNEIARLSRRRNRA